jgi:DNA-binding transcriptional LysR family regulator
VRTILSAIDEAEACEHEQTSEMAGPVRIHTEPVLAAYVLAPLVAEFRLRHPKVSFEIIVDNAVSAPVEDYDITILNSNSQYDANVVARPVIVTDLLLCASPIYLDAADELLAPADLGRHSCLRLERPGQRPQDWTLINPRAADAQLTVEVAPTLVTNDIDTLLRAALAGAGIGAHPATLVSHYLREGRLRRVLAPWIVGRITIYAALPSRKYVPARARAFLDFLIELTRTRAVDAESGWMHRPGMIPLSRQTMRVT